jgi:Fic family protein
MGMSQYLDEYWIAEGQGRTRKEKMGGAYHPYLPDKLVGQDFYLHGEVAFAVSRAEEAIRQLNRHVSALTNTEILARLLLRAEAVASSRIEGLEVSPRKVLQEEEKQKAIKGHHASTTAAEVLGNVNAMALALDGASLAKEITVDTLCAIHEQLMQNTRFSECGGRIRTVQNWIGKNSYNPIGANYVPPRPDDVPDLVTDLVAFCNEKRLSPLHQAALAHAQFETIHPFEDGNGRTGRALLHLILRRRGLAEKVVPPVSLVLATYAEDYVRFLTGYRYSGEASSKEAVDGKNEWIEFFVACCERAASDAQSFEGRIQEIQSEWRKKIASRQSSTVNLLIDALPGVPIVSVYTAAEATGRGIEASRLAIDLLIKNGILKQTTEGKRNRTFEAEEIIKAFTAFERSLATASGDTRAETPARPVPRRVV